MHKGIGVKMDLFCVLVNPVAGVPSFVGGYTAPAFSKLKSVAKAFLLLVYFFPEDAEENGG